MDMKSTLLEEIKLHISEWEKDDIYAVSLYVYDNDDNPCEPTVTLGYNTTENVSHEVKQGAEEQEAKWNYAFWLQNQELVFGVDETQQMVKDWIEKSGFCYYSSDELFGGEIEPDEESYEGITEAFVQALIEIVQELHSSGFIQKQFGREIPILIHELEYYDEIAEQNIKANSIELVEEFVAFCKGE